MYKWAGNRRANAVAKANLDCALLLCPRLTGLYLYTSQQPGPGNRELVDAFFTDYSIVPLMVQQNYLKVQVRNATAPNVVLDKMSAAADAIVDGDLVSFPLFSPDLRQSLAGFERLS